MPQNNKIKLNPSLRLTKLFDPTETPSVCSEPTANNVGVQIPSFRSDPGAGEILGGNIRRVFREECFRKINRMRKKGRDQPLALSSFKNSDRVHRPPWSISPVGRDVNSLLNNNSYIGDSRQAAIDARARKRGGLSVEKPTVEAINPTESRHDGWNNYWSFSGVGTNERRVESSSNAGHLKSNPSASELELKEKQLQLEKGWRQYCFYRTRNPRNALPPIASRQPSRLSQL